MTDIALQAPAPASGSRAWKAAGDAERREKTSVDQASYFMLCLFQTNLEVRFRSIDEASLQSENQKQNYATVKEMLNGPCDEHINRNLAWDRMYKAESLIALLLSGSQLRQEIAARLQELAGESLAEATALRREYEAALAVKPAAGGANAGPDEAGLRAFLLRVLETSHWLAKKKYLARPIRKKATKNILSWLFISFLLLVLPYGVLNTDFAPTNAVVGKFWSLFALYTALTAGLLGAFFSQLYSIQRHWGEMTLEEVFSHREFSYTLLRAGVGMCGALIVYIFLRSGIAEGALFPKFDEMTIDAVDVAKGPFLNVAFVMPSKALALFTFWCFVAGFSEALVPKILSSTETQLADAASPGQKRRK